MDDALENVLALLRRGVSLEDAAKGLEWRAFEGVSSQIFSENGYREFRNFRFSSKKKRYEVDIVAISMPRIILADCKHWSLRAGKGSALKKAAEAQMRRALEFGSKLQEFKILGIADHDKAILIPIIITLHEEGIAFSNGVTVVPLSRLNSFIDGVSAGLLDGIKVGIPRLY
uniref:NERD domain-containing protein n=1 Tax=Candidatus Methanomethylicus mesodigestus TaxID=1867258 RepID=A0A7C3F3X1_9CREN